MARRKPSIALTDDDSGVATLNGHGESETAGRDDRPDEAASPDGETAPDRPKRRGRKAAEPGGDAPAGRAGARAGRKRKEAEADEGESEEDRIDTEIDGVPLLSIVEALLFSTDAPLSTRKIAQIIGKTTPGAIKNCIDVLNARYEQVPLAYRIESIANGYQMLTLPVFNPWLANLRKVRSESRLTSAALETLAIVAYRQPIIRADVEAIRGVAAGDLLKRLREANLIKIVGRAEDVGRPVLYGTTTRFLDAFGLGSLEDLPSLEGTSGPPKLKLSRSKTEQSDPSASEPDAPDSPGGDDDSSR